MSIPTTSPSASPGIVPFLRYAGTAADLRPGHRRLRRPPAQPPRPSAAEGIEPVSLSRRVGRRFAMGRPRAVTEPAQQFFRDNPSWKSLEPEDLARAYVQHYLDSGALAGPARAQAKSNRPFHISVASDQDSLEVLTRRAPLVADQLVVTHASGEVYVFSDSGTRAGKYLVSEAVGPVKRRAFGMDLVGPSADIREKTYVHCSGLVELGNYLRAVEPMLQAGLVTYLPRVSKLEDEEVGPFDQFAYNDEVGAASGGPGRSSGGHRPHAGCTREALLPPPAPVN